MFNIEESAYNRGVTFIYKHPNATSIEIVCAAYDEYNWRNPWYELCGNDLIWKFVEGAHDEQDRQRNRGNNSF